MSLNVVLDSELDWSIPDLTSSFGFLYGPLLYLYIKSLVYKGFKPKQADLLHTLPWFTASLSTLLLPVPIIVTGIAIFISISAYLSLCFRLIQYFHKVIRNTQSRFSSIALQWMQRVLYSMIVITIIDAIHNALSINNLMLENIFYAALITALLFFVTSLVFNGLRQPELFQGVSEEDEALLTEVNERYASSKVSQQELDEFKGQILIHFDKERPFLDSDITIQKLAEALNLSNKLLSEVINRCFDQNFSEFVNSYRVNEAIRIFESEQDKQKTILEILYEVGFNSKSSFYTAFKQKTGQTPTAYKKRFS